MQLKVTPRLEERINARWLHWHPWMLMAARKKLPFVSLDISLHAARILHQQRYIEALRQRIPETTIRRNSLDDPRLHQDQFQKNIQAALARRAPRMGRRKGIRRSHQEIYKEITA